MAKTSILLKMGLDTSKLKASLDKAKAGVKDFSTNAKTGFESLKKSFGGISSLASGAIVSGFVAATKSAMNYGKEMTNLANISGAGFKEFQKLADGAKTVGIENTKLADIFKDVNDKVGDFLQAGSGPMVDFFEFIAPAVGVTAEEFKNLSGPQALQLYYDSIAKANLSQQEMTFYMEAIASDATALVPLLANGGEAFKKLGEEAEKAGRIMSLETAEALKQANIELENIGTTGTISMGRLVKAMKEVNKEELLRFPYAMTMALYDEFFGEIDEKKTESTEKAKELLKTETEALRKENAERIKLHNELDKNNEKIASEKEKRAALEQTSMEALIAAELKRLKAYEDLQEAVASGNKLEASKKEVAYAEALTKEAIARKKAKEDLAKKDAEITEWLKKGSELSAEIAKQVVEESKERELLAEQVKLQGELKDAIARGDLEAVKTAEKALDIEEQILRVINDHNVTRPEAVAHVKALMAEEQKLIDEKENAAAQEKAQKEKMLDLERQLVDAQASGNDGLAREIQNRIDKEQMALDLMDKLGISIDEAREKAEKLAAVNAGPDLNQSGFVTPGEQRKFDRQQKERQKQQDEINDLEERDERERGGGIPNVSRDKRKTGTVRERMEADREQKIRTRENKALGKIDRDQKLNEEQKRAAINEILEARNKRIQKNKPKGEEPKGEEPKGEEPKVGAPPLGADGKPVDANGQPLPGGGGDPNAPGGGGGEGPKEPKKPEQLIVDKLGTKLDDIKTELEKIEKHLQC